MQEENFQVQGWDFYEGKWRIIERFNNKDMAIVYYEEQKRQLYIAGVRHGSRVYYRIQFIQVIDEVRND